LEDVTDPTRRKRLAPLNDALERGDFKRLVELLIEAETRLSESLRQQRGHEASLDAREMIRFAERYLALAVRRGQEAGVVETPREASVRVLMETRGRESASSHKVKMREVMPGLSKLFPLADATMAQFEAALTACRARRRMGRADVTRELTRLIALADAQRPEELRGRRHLDVNKVLTAVVGTSGISEVVEAQLDWTKLDLTRAEEFDQGLRDVINNLNRLRGRLERRVAGANRASKGGRR
jgi:hypothetical protein